MPRRSANGSTAQTTIAAATASTPGPAGSAVPGRPGTEPGWRSARQRQAEHGHAAAAKAKIVAGIRTALAWRAVQRSVAAHFECRGHVQRAVKHAVARGAHELKP